MATSAWLRGPSAMRLTEGLVSVLKEQRPDYIPVLLSGYREHGVFHTQGASAVAGLVGYSNAKLGSSKTRFEGLCLLSMLVKDSSSDLFQQHCLSWLRSLQQIIQSQAPVQTIQLAVNILKDVLHYSSQIPELAREVGLNSVLGILTSLLGLKTECELAAMEGMTACMTRYPRACGSLKDKLAAYFLSKMDSTNKKTQETACQCFAHLPCLGGVLDRGAGAGRAEGWTNQVHCLLASANSHLALIYQGAEIEGTMQYEGPGVELPFPPLDQSDPLFLLQLQHRLTAVCLALRYTLRVDPTLAVRIPVRPILNLVCRALAISCKNINLTGDGNVRLLILPIVHLNILEVLSALIIAVRSSMVQYATVLQRLFSQTLSAWTPAAEASLGQQRAFSSVRVAVYKTLELWLQVAGASTSILQGSPNHAEILFSHLLSDITPGAESVKLRVGLSADVVPGGKPGPRRTKPLVISDTVGPLPQRKGDAMANQDTCLTALRALRQIILASGTLLKDDIHKRLHDLLLPLCVRLQQQQQSSSSMSADLPLGVSGQYSSALTRRELYRLLLALVLVPSPCWPPPLTCVVSIFSSGRTDRNLKVSTFCSEALTICNSLLHPRSPSIALPMPPLPIKPTHAVSVLPTPQASAPSLTLPTLLGEPTPAPPLSSPHPLGLGSSSLLGSLENHLSLVPGLRGQSSAPGEMILSPHAAHHQDLAGLGPLEGQRPVFVRYDREEAEDVEISLASDSDDSVVIVPPGMLNVENQQQDDAATNSQSATAAAPARAAAVALAEGVSVSMVANTAPGTPIDGVPLPNDLTTAAPLLSTSAAPINSFPPSSTSVVSLVPALNSNALTAPPGGLADSMPCRPQLQQMLMQPSAAVQPGPLALPLQIHQMQSQLGQQGRPLQHPPPAASNEDSGVININSTDEEEEEEDMEDDEDLEEEEDEEGVEEEEEEEDEVSDFADDEFYDGEDYEEFDEEAEELEEEDEEDGDIPPLEGAEEQGEQEEVEPGRVLQAAVEAAEIVDFSVVGEAGGGIEEIQTKRVPIQEDRIKVQEVESIGVLEEAREGETEEDEAERVSDPTMPQILCVTGGSLEEKEAGRGQEEASSWQRDATETEPQSSSGEAAASASEQEKPGGEQQSTASPDQPSSREKAQQVPTAEGDAASNRADSSDQSAQEPPEAAVEKWESAPAEQQQESHTGSEEEGKGVKRKREEIEGDEREESSKQADDEAMASMLADFVACPPDEDDGPSASNQS